MHVDVRQANFTTKPHLRTKFFAFALFVRECSFQLYRLENSDSCKTFQIYSFGTRLCGDNYSSDLILGISFPCIRQSLSDKNGTI